MSLTVAGYFGRGSKCTSLSDISNNAVRAAVEPLVSPYGDGVAVVYTPVDAPDGGFAINGDERMRSASMIKTLIMATLLQREADGSISLGDSYTIRESEACRIRSANDT